jgi:hypothetical protein
LRHGFCARGCQTWRVFWFRPKKPNVTGI